MAIAEIGVKRLNCRHARARQVADSIAIPSVGEKILSDEFGAKMVKLVVRDRETIQEAVRRFRKLVERSGIKKEMRRREYYEKPSETNRRARLRAERRARRTRLLSR
ncbi:30S ribosomal protein S21 [Rubripirellula tenax]|uniref:Small ribosomal subunit protein bS21 n=2 Tax=Rubripirellula TaxID=1579505 RepID=A0A5C6EBU6_9BACT|nr:30S ribosomal protein S21 [Rubripirellula tenax]